MDGDTVTDFSHQVKACALGQASSSIMARNVVGAKADELRGLRETVRRMLKENGAPPAGKWADIAVLEPVRDYKARHASTMLTFDAVTAAIDQIEAKRRAAMGAESAPPSLPLQANAVKRRSAFRAHARHRRAWRMPRAWHMLKVLLVARGGGLADGHQRRCRLGRLRPRKVALEQRVGG